MHYDCLIVDDEEALGQSACEYFNLFDVRTAWVPDASKCLAFLDDHGVDLILLDINLGEDSGFSLCKRLREEHDMPILFISARQSDDDVLLALGLGGDDYIAKPFSLSILLAKVKSVLRRYRGEGSPGSKENNIFAFDTFILDFGRMRLMSGGEEVKLKAMEYKLLAYLVQNRNNTIPKEELFRNVWNEAITGNATLNVHVRRLREKIEADPNNPKYIKTIWGVGYRFELADA